MNKHSEFMRYHKAMKPLVESIELNATLTDAQFKLHNTNKKLAAADYISTKMEGNPYKTDINALGLRLKKAELAYQHQYQLTEVGTSRTSISSLL